MFPRNVSRSLGVLVVLSFLVSPALGGDLPEQATGAPDNASWTPWGQVPADADWAEAQEEPIIDGALNAEEVVTDPEGDTDLLLVGANPVPAGDLDAPADIVSLSAAETDTFILFSLKARAYPDVQATLSEVALGSDLFCDFSWSINRDDAVRYGVFMFSENFLDGGPYQTFANAYVQFQDEDNDTERDSIDWIPSAHVDGDHFEFLMPKPWMVKAWEEGEDPEDQEGETLAVGDELTDFQVTCQKRHVIFGWFIDEADDATSAYAITISRETPEISLSLEDGVFFGASVPVGETRTVSVEVENLLDRKLLVNVTAELLDEAGKALSGWTVRAAETLELAAGRTLPATLVITAPESAQHRDGATLKVTAFPLGFEDRAVMTGSVQAVQSPDVDHNVIYFHNVPQDFCFLTCGLPVEDQTNQVIDFFGDNFVMNVLDDDPTLTDEETSGGLVGLFSSSWSFSYLDAPLANPIRFDDDGVIRFDVALRSMVEREVRLETHLFADMGGYLAGGITEVTVTQGFSVHTLEFLVQAEDTTVREGDVLLMQTRIQENTLPNFRLSSGTWMAPVEWAPDQTSLTLPLVKVAQSKIVNVTDGRALPTIALGNATDAEEYINPGNAQAFDLVLVNEGTEDDVLKLSADLSDPRWTVVFDPGNEFALPSGSAAPMCVSVVAPEDLEEGEMLVLNLTATSRNDEAVSSTTTLFITVTTGVPIDPDSCRELGEGEYVAPLLSEKKDSPGVALPLIVVGALGLAAGLRRRV